MEQSHWPLRDIDNQRAEGKHADLVWGGGKLLQGQKITILGWWIFQTLWMLLNSAFVAWQP